MIRLYQLPKTWLGQAARSSTVLVTVRDAQGRPLPGAIVHGAIRGGVFGTGESDRAGDVRLVVPAGAGDIELTARFGDYVQRIVFGESALRRGETAVVQFQICAPVPLVTTAEGAALIIGGAVTAAGFYWKEDAAKLLGEILVGAAAFTFIYRHSCP